MSLAGDGPFSDEELSAFAARYELGSLRKAEGIEAGTVNSSYVLELERGRHFLRIYEEQDQHGAAREARVLAHLAARGVPTPAPVLARDGTASGRIAGKPAALFPWVVVGPSAAASLTNRQHRGHFSPDARATST